MFLLLASLFAFIVATAATIMVIHDLYVWQDDNWSSSWSTWALLGCVAVVFIWITDALLQISAFINGSDDAYAIMATINVVVLSFYGCSAFAALVQLPSEIAERRQKKQQLEYEQSLRQLDPFSAVWAKFLKKVAETESTSDWVSAKEQLLNQRRVATRSCDSTT